MKNLSIRSRLWLATLAAVLGLALLASLTLLAGKRGDQALTTVVDQNLKPLLAVQRIDSTLGAIRNRAAGLLLDHYPLPGTINHLQEAREAFLADWAVVSASTPASEEEAELLKALVDGQPKVLALMDDLAKVYASGQTDEVDELLQLPWAMVHKFFIKPLTELATRQQSGAEAVTAAARKSSQQQLFVALALALVAAVAVGGLMFTTTRRIVSALDESVEHATAIAQGNLGRSIATGSRDELGALSSALEAMRLSLAKVVDDIRNSADGINTASAEIASGNQDLSSRTEQAA
ncbi:MCP four helix bundle domain-containing protein, partial [Hydrogenophaga sp.]|uniref:HAMP domain-containing protein n=1 Tax=Hydrogenophaga sp. TaxID=1904254 RepID=UPI0025B835DD